MPDSSNLPIPWSSAQRVPPGRAVTGILLVLIVAALAFATTETLWRLRGHKPSITDDEALWAIYRERLDQCPGAMVLAGDSRILGSISTDTIRKRLPGKDVFQLGVGGSGPVALLRDLGEGTARPGLLVCGVDELVLAEANWNLQREHVEFFHKRLTLNTKLNRLASLYCQTHLVAIQQYLNLRACVRSALVRRGLRSPNPVVLQPDRSVRYTFARLSAADQQEHVANSGREVRIKAKHAGESTMPAEWTMNIQEIHRLTRQIQAKGTKVIFVRLPTSGPRREAENELFPRRLYWDVFAAESPADLVLHFEDDPELAHFTCGDSSHLDYADACRFTERLLQVLKNRHLLRQQ